MVTEASPRECARADALAALAILPQLAQEDMLPEVNSLAIGHDGRLTLRGRPREVTVVFRHAGQCLTARLTRDGDGPVLLEVGCRLVRLPYTIEARESRRELARRIAEFAAVGIGELAIAPRQWLYLHDRLLLDPVPFTASWLVTQLTLAALALAPRGSSSSRASGTSGLTIRRRSRPPAVTDADRDPAPGRIRVPARTQRRNLGSATVLGEGRRRPGMGHEGDARRRLAAGPRQRWGVPGSGFRPDGEDAGRPSRNLRPRSRARRSWSRARYGAWSRTRRATRRICGPGCSAARP